MRSVAVEEARARSLKALRLVSETAALDSAEALASNLRRAAGFQCPASRGTLVQAVSDSLQSLLNTPPQELRERLYDLVEDLMSHGDLLEFEDVTGFATDGSEVFRAPPSFVGRESGAVLLLGVAPDHVSPLTADLQEQVTHNEHVRAIWPSEGLGREVGEKLKDLGLIEVPLNSWLKAPTPMAPADHLMSLQERLSKEPQCGEVEGLSLLDSESSVRYYRGRWTVPRGSHSGFFVGRRPQAFGADLWCFVEMDEGKPIRLLDLLRDRVGRGCDRAWRLQAAIDHERGSPQICNVQEKSDRRALLSFFHPVPQWARRRWTALGRPARQSGALFGYEIPLDEWPEERQYLTEVLWMTVLP